MSPRLFTKNLVISIQLIYFLGTDTVKFRYITYLLAGVPFVFHKNSKIKFIIFSGLIFRKKSIYLEEM